MINTVILMGRLTAAPEIKTTTSGKTVARFTVAVDRDYASNGEKIADFIPCNAWDKTAEFVGKYFGKGAMIAVLGSLQANSVEKNGEKRTYYSVKVDKVSFTGETAKAAISGEYGAENAGYAAEDNNDAAETDDDLPF